MDESTSNGKGLRIERFDSREHDIGVVAELILEGDGTNDAFRHNGESGEFIKSLIASGNNCLGHENIYVSSDSGRITGVLVCYPGRGYGRLGELAAYFISMGFIDFIAYLLSSAYFLHAGFTPDLTDRDYYISVLVVENSYRQRGVGSSLLAYAIELARQKALERVVLHVNAQNTQAIGFYEHHQFSVIIQDKESNDGNYKMVRELN